MPNIAFVLDDVKKALPGWELIEDCLGGQEEIKKKASKYLPIPNVEVNPEAQAARYASYIGRASFFNVTGRTLDGLAGQVFAKEPETSLPDPLARYQDDIDGAGTSLEQQSKVALRMVLSKGHGGLLTDFPVNKVGPLSIADVESGRYRPRILVIQPHNIINWRSTVVGGETLLVLVVIAENKVISDDGFEQEVEPRWRVLRLLNPESEPFVEVTVWREVNDQDERTGNEQFVIDEGPYTLLTQRREPMRRIPFEFMGSTNNEPAIDKPPLLDLAYMNIAHYRNSADYEESLFLVGQPTLVIGGLSEEWASKHINGKVLLGSRSAIPLPKDGKADLLQPHPNIMPKEGMEHKEEQMRSIGAKLIEPNFSKVTATEVVMEAASETSILSTTANNVSSAYRKALYFASLFVGEVALSDVIFALNTDFSITRMTPQERQQIREEWMSGLTSWAEARQQLRDNDIELTKDEEARSVIDSELDLQRGDGEGEDGEE